MKNERSNDWLALVEYAQAAMKIIAIGPVLNFDRYVHLQKVFIGGGCSKQNPIQLYLLNPPMNVQESKRMLRPCLVLCLCCAMAACGGGFRDYLADGTEPLPVLVASARPARATVPVPVTKHTVTDVSCGLNGRHGIQTEVLQRVNALRAAGAVCGATTYVAVAPLTWNSDLLKAAQGHSSDMAKNNYFSHNRPDGSTPAQRVRATGYRYTAVGENIAAGQPTVEKVVTKWIDSPGHCQNLMNPRFRNIGVACARNDATTYHLYWTMDLGGT